MRRRSSAEHTVNGFREAVSAGDNGVVYPGRQRAGRKRRYRGRERRQWKRDRESSRKPIRPPMLHHPQNPREGRAGISRACRRERGWPANLLYLRPLTFYNCRRLQAGQADREYHPLFQQHRRSAAGDRQC